jgi:H+/Cl- antiporter ClcA
MGNLWLKIKLWTKVVIAVVLAVLLILLLWGNYDAKVTHVYLIFRDPKDLNFLLVALITAILSIFGWWFMRTVVKTLRQFREARERARTGRLERELADMKAKAAKLQTRPEQSPAQPPSPEERGTE